MALQLQQHWSEWKYSNYFVDVHPIHDVQVDSGTVYRGSITPIYIKIGDNTTSQSEFYVELQINITDSEWSKQFLVQPQFNGELWEGYFVPSLEMKPGLYQIRGRTTEDMGRSTDNGSRTTPWLYLLDVQVFNNAPEISEVIFSNTTLQRNQEATLKLNITDMEHADNLSVLDVKVYYFDKLDTIDEIREDLLS